MACTATVRQAGEVVIVDLIGRVTLGDGSGVLRETVKELVQQGQILVLLNIAQVSYMDSAGLGELVGSYASITHQGGQIRLLNAQSKVMDVLRITRLHHVFENFTDEATALRSFHGRASA